MSASSYRENEYPQDSTFCGSCRKKMTAGKSKLRRVTVLSRFFNLVTGVDDRNLFFDENSSETYKIGFLTWLFTKEAKYFWGWFSNPREPVGNLYRTSSGKWIVEIGGDCYLIEPEDALQWFLINRITPPADLVSQKEFYVL
jgi:hypothetical protein